MNCVVNSEHQKKPKTTNSNNDLNVLARRLERRVNQKSMGDDREGHEMSMGDTVKLDRSAILNEGIEGAKGTSSYPI